MLAMMLLFIDAVSIVPRVGRAINIPFFTKDEAETNFHDDITGGSDPSDWKMM